MNKYNVVMEISNSTVVTEYKPVQKRSDSYQSEAALEKEFIKMLEEQGYDYLQIHDSSALINNLRKQIELLNKYRWDENKLYKTISFLEFKCRDIETIQK